LPDISPPAALLEARGLGRRFGTRWALAHLDLTVERGEVLFIAGSNGAGKTTFLRLVAGLARPTTGEVRLAGLEPSRDRMACRSLVSLVSHDAFLYDRLTAAETVRLWARLLGRRLGAPEALALLDSVGLAESADSTVGGFSAGMRKRLALARLSIEEPELVLLDEPFAALDEAGKRWIERWIADAPGRGLTVLLASHDLERASALAGAAVWLRRGQLYWTGAAGDLPPLYRESA
jgi:heme exporter protein A